MQKLEIQSGPLGEVSPSAAPVAPLSGSTTPGSNKLSPVNRPSRKEVVLTDYEITKINEMTPFGVNRYFLLAIYLLIDLLAGSTLWGWDGFQSLLYRSGAYAWECEGLTELDSITIHGDTFVDCPNRKTKINNMFTAGFATSFLASTVGGIVLDFVGAKVCGLMGLGCTFLGYLLLSLSTEAFQCYYPAIILIGFGADAGYFPLLGVAQLFPGSKSLIMGCLGSLRSASFCIPVVLGMVAYSLELSPENTMSVLLVYTLVFLGACLLLTIIFVPMKQIETTLTHGEVMAYCILPNNSEVEGKCASTDALSTSPTAAVSEKNSTTGDVDVELANTTEPKSIEPVPRGYVPISGPLSAYLLSYEFICLLVVFATMILRTEFYTKSHKEQLTVEGVGDVYAVFSICNILSFLPGPAAGWCCDRFGVHIVQAVMNSVGIVMYGFAMINSLVPKGISAFLVIFYMSFVVSNLYVYVLKYFPREQFGRLCGIGSMAGGILSLTSIPLYNASVNGFESFVPVDSLLVVVGIIVLFIIAGAKYCNTHFNLYVASKSI